MLQDPILSRVYDFCSSILPKKSSIVVGVSGGSDSIALLFILKNLVKELGINKLYVAHINHGLRGKESDEEENFVKKVTENLGIKFFSKRISGHSLYESGLEAWARKERYDFFDEIRNQTNSNYVATAHTMDDQAETILMRILRGCGLNGLRGIAELKDGYIIRPLLKIRKYELKEWLKKNNIDYKEDSSNADIHFMRNKVRHLIIPTIESCGTTAVKHLAEIATEAQFFWKNIADDVNKWIKKNIVETSENSFLLKKEGLEENIVTLEALREVFFLRGIPTTRYHLEKILKDRFKRCGTFLLPKGWSYSAGKEFFYFEKEKNSFNFILKIPGVNEISKRNERIIIKEEEKIPDDLNTGKDTIYINREKIGTICYYRNLKKKDKFIPFGLKKEIEVDKFLSKQGLVKAEREKIGGIFSEDDRLIWIPNVRMDERFRVNTTTKRVLKLQYEKLV